MAKSTLIDISSSTIIRVILFCLVFWLLFLIKDVLLMLLAAIIISFVIEPVAQKLRAFHIPRGISVVIVYLVLLGLLATAAVLILPALAQQTSQLASQLPDLVHGIESKMGRLPGFNPDLAVPQLQQGLSSVGNNLANLSSTILQQTKSVFSGVFSLLFVFIIAFYLVIEEHALKKLFRFVVPRQHMAYVELMIDRIQAKLGRWVLAQLFLGVLVGVCVGTLLWLFGVKYALALGLVAALLEVFPFIGPLISGVVGTFIALSQSVTLGLITLIVYVVVQQVENHILIPNIMRKATGLNPIVTLIAILLGGRLAGVAGVILSVPIATILGIILADFFSTAASDDELPG